MNIRKSALGVVIGAASVLVPAAPALAGDPLVPMTNPVAGVSGNLQIRWATPAADGTCMHQGQATIVAPLSIADVGVWYRDANGALQLIGDGENLKGEVKVLLDRGHTPDYTPVWEVRSVTETRDRAAGTRTFTPGADLLGTFQIAGAPTTGCVTA